MHQTIATLRRHDGDINVTAEYLGIDARLARTALAYYADHTDEADADHEDARARRRSRAGSLGSATTGRRAKLARDHHYSPKIAEQLRTRGHDAAAAKEPGWEECDDEPVLGICTGEVRALLTNNVAVFTLIARRWAIENRSHAGLMFASDASMPRQRETIDRYVSVLDQLHRKHIEDDAPT